MILLTLLLDGETEADTLWDLCFHLYVPNRSVDILGKQAMKLRALSESLTTWNESTYGHKLKWCDEGSLLLTSKVWETRMGPISQSEEDAARYEAFAIRFRNYHTALNSTTVTGHIPEEARSAAPLALPSIKEDSQEYKQYWKYITLPQSSTQPNPLYAAMFSMDHSLAHTINPLFGFHLATAFAQLAPTSPLRFSQDGKNTPKVVRAVKTQFREWCIAFQAIASDYIIIRLAIACPLTFCHTLQHNSVTQASSAGHFRRQFDASRYELDPNAYGTDGEAPRLFDAIDTSAVTDKLGAINAFVSSSPLLKDVASSTLYMEIWKDPNETYKDMFDSLFFVFGHTPTISMLLGLVPVDYWTNSTLVSYVDELMLMSSLTSTPNETIPNYARVSWKYSKYFLAHIPAVNHVQLEPVDLAKMIFRIFTRMLERQEQGSESRFSGPERKKYNVVNGDGHVYHTRNFVAFIKQMLYTVNVDPAKTCGTLLDLVQHETSSSLCRELHIELDLELRLQGLYTGNITGFHKKINRSGSVVVLKVPRDEAGKVRGIIKSNGGSLRLEAIISYHKGSSDPSRARFTNLQLTFGDIRITGDLESDDYSVTIVQDSLVHHDDSPQIISFYIPSTLIQRELDISSIAIIERHPPTDVKKPETIVYETVMSNQQNVFITSCLTNVHDRPITGALTVATTSVTRTLDSLSPTSTRWYATLDPVAGRISNITVTVEIVDENKKSLLRDQHSTLLTQTSPCNFDISIGEDSVYRSSFPLPVLKDTVKIHVDPNLGLVAFSSPVAKPLDLEPFSELMYPVAVGNHSVPIPINGGHINLDSLPILSVDEADRQANQWLTTLTSHQFSLRERRVREELMASLIDPPNPMPFTSPRPSPRMSFKESLFTVFMVSSGLQGGSTGLFALADQESGRGNQILLFVRAIRLDCASGSVVADAAALPLTRDLIDSRELETFLLVLRELEICVLDVDDAELDLWRHAIPAFAEQCRDWVHDVRMCDYGKPGATVPPTASSEQQFMCSCGNGKIPRDFVRLPEWEGVASRHAVRVAISPAFASPFVEDIVDVELLRAQGGLEGLLKEKCRNCNATKGKKGGKLMWCMRCRAVRYCSQDCQKKDWKKHRMECKPVAD